MLWFVSNEIDNPTNVNERKNFYSNLTGIELSTVGENGKLYMYNDGRNDNRCMIIGHTDSAYDAIDILRIKSLKKYKFYICVCIMHPKDFFRRCKFIKDDEVYISEQDIVIVNGQHILGCEFIDAGLGFKVTRPELSMYNSPLNGFHSKLDKSFIHLNKTSIKR